MSGTIFSAAEEFDRLSVLPHLLCFLRGFSMCFLKCDTPLMVIVGGVRVRVREEPAPLALSLAEVFSVLCIATTARGEFWEGSMFWLGSGREIRWAGGPSLSSVTCMEPRLVSQFS